MRPVEKRITENYRTIAEIKERTDTPSETLEQARETLGDLRPVAEAIATAVNLKDWDGRISEQNKSWAKRFTENGRKRYETQTPTYSTSEGEYMSGIDRIHPAHLDQLADLIRKEWEALPDYPSDWTPEQLKRWSDYRPEAPASIKEFGSPESLRQIDEACAIIADTLGLTIVSEPQEAPTESQEDQTPTTALKNALEATPTRSAWQKGVTEYSVELVTDNEALEKALSLKPFNPNKRSLIRLALLNGATSWSEYSWGGCSLIYDPEIAERLCTPSELKKTRNGQRDPNKWEQWLDTQARALNQAENLIFRTLERLGMVEA